MKSRANMIKKKLERNKNAIGLKTKDLTDDRAGFD